MAIPYLAGAYVVDEHAAKATGYPFTLPFARTLNVKLDDRVTIFVGENGSGKSTIVEAIAELMGLPWDGGSGNEVADSERTATPRLAQFMRPRVKNKPRNKYFFRAEALSDFGRLLEAREKDPYFGGALEDVRSALCERHRVKPLFFENPAEFGAWLKTHHAKETELLVGFHKTKTGKPTLTWPQSVDEALCYGWIDGRRTSLGETSYTIRFTPRKPTSHWSAVNLKRVPELIAEKRMKPAGLLAYERRSEGKSGQYSFEQRKSIEFTAEALKTFRANAAAWKWFEKAAPSYRTAAKHWVMSAKKEETRAKRLAILIESSAAGMVIPPMRYGRGHTT